MTLTARPFAPPDLDEVDRLSDALRADFRRKQPVDIYLRADPEAIHLERLRRLRRELGLRTFPDIESFLRQHGIDPLHQLYSRRRSLVLSEDWRQHGAIGPRRHYISAHIHIRHRGNPSVLSSVFRY